MCITGNMSRKINQLWCFGQKETKKGDAGNECKHGRRPKSGKNGKGACRKTYMKMVHNKNIEGT